MARPFLCMAYNCPVDLVPCHINDQYSITDLTIMVYRLGRFRVDTYDSQRPTCHLFHHLNKVLKCQVLVQKNSKEFRVFIICDRL